MRRSLLCSLSALALAAVTSTAFAAGPSSARYARGTSNVFWFMHISDLHVGVPSILGPHAEEHVELAFQHAADVIKPAFIMATGDLVDGSRNNIPTSGQEQSEWNDYKDLYTQAGMTPDYYFDLPGNHDGYGDKGLTYYLANSLQGQANNALYTAWTVTMPMGEYLFVGLNSAGEGGTIFNNPQAHFTDDEVVEFEGLLSTYSNAQLVIVGAHHPLDNAVNGDAITSLIKGVGGGYYLHGHNHERRNYLSGDNFIVVNELKSVGRDDTDNVAVGVVDNNAFVYRSTSTAELWPLVIITAPVARDLEGGVRNPFAYSVCRDRTDNPVRALVFADAAPARVVAQIGPSPAAELLPTGVDNLYEGVVDTSGIATGVQEVTVTAEVGSVMAFHRISVDFVPGPCSELPADPVAPDAGVDAPDDAPLDDAGVDPDSSVDPDAGVGGAGGEGGAAGAGGEAGAAGAAGQGGFGGAAGGNAGSGEGGADSGAAGWGPYFDGGIPEAGSDAESPDTQAPPLQSADNEGGCGCRLADAQSPTKPFALLALAGLAAALIRRRK